jgi:hypothetical protein
MRSRALTTCRRVGLVAALAGVALVAACHVPTDLPTWNTTWVTPGDSLHISVAQLLPDGVSVVPSLRVAPPAGGAGIAANVSTGDSVFTVPLEAIEWTAGLTVLCPACATLHGTVAAKPAFSYTQADTTTLPARLVEAAAVGGTITYRITNHFAFDPLRPSATARGSLAITVSQGGAELVRVTIDGASDSLPPGDSLERQLTIPPVSITGPIVATVHFDSPAGDPVAIDTTETIHVAAVDGRVMLGETTLAVDSDSVSVDPTTVSTGDLDHSVTDRVTGGALILDVENPFAELQVAGTLTIATESVVITKRVTIPGGRSTVEVPFTGAELHAVVGQPNLEISLHGTVSSPSGHVTVRPTDVIVLHTSFKIDLTPTER